MAESQVDNLSNNILISLLHCACVCYFTLLTANLVTNFLRSPVSQAKDTLPDVLAVISLYLGAIGCSASQLLVRFWQWLDYAGVILLIWASAVPFIYFQFYFEKWTLAFIMFVISLGGARCIASVVYAQQPEISRKICVGFGLCVLIPAVYAGIRNSNCRYPLAAEFVKYSICNLTGGLFYILELPDRWTPRPSLRINHFIMHAAIVGSVVAFSGKLLTAYLSPGVSSSMECRRWSW